MRVIYYSIKLYYNKKLPRAKIENFLLEFNRLSKINKFKYFYSLTDLSGFEVIKRTKKLQAKIPKDNNKYPIITNEEERKLIKPINNDKNILILVINDNSKNSKKEINCFIKTYNFFLKNNAKDYELKDLELVTPYNKRHNHYVLQASFIVSDLAAEILKLEKSLNLEKLPKIFFIYCYLSSIFQDIFSENQIDLFVVEYYKYLKAYLNFDQNDENKLKKSTEKYFFYFKKIRDGEYKFQNSTELRISIKKWIDSICNNKKLLENIGKERKDEKVVFQIVHWIFNASMENFAREIFLIFCLEKYGK